MKILQYGLGRWGQNHNRILREFNHDVIVIELDNFIMPSKHSSCNRPDAVIITCSSVNHHPILMDCLYNEIPVYCEKPICTNNLQLSELVAFASLNPLACMMGGFQLLQLPELSLAAARHPIFFSSDRTGAIPRTEGAILSLAVHDIAMAYYVFERDPSFDAHLIGGSHFAIDHASGNKHHAKLSLSLFNKTAVASILVQSISHIRLRHSSVVCGDGSIFSIAPDNWNRTDLLRDALEMFLMCAKSKSRPPLANITFSARVMMAAFKCLEAIDGSL